MNYYAKDDKGEICFRGGNLMNGYFQMPEKTAETIGKIHIFLYYQKNLFMIRVFHRKGQKFVITENRQK